MARRQTKEVAVQEDMFPTERPDYLPKDGDTGRGQENVGIEDLSIPRISIIQALSPQRKKNDPEYIDGAEEGMIFNSVTNMLYGESILFVPCYFRKEWLIWKDKEAGGGFNGAFPSEEAAKTEWEEQGYGDITHKDDNGNNVHSYEIVETAQHFGLVVRPESTIENPIVDDAVISMSKSKMKANRQLNTMVKMNGGDRFSRVYEIKAVEVSGKKGEYYNFAVHPKGFVSEALYCLGEKMYDAVSSGERDVKRDDVVEDAA